MSAITKLMTAGGGGVALTPASSIASDVTVNVPSQNCTLGIQGPAFRAYTNASQTIGNSTFTKVQLQVESFDTANCFDNATNYRFTPNLSGYYQVNAMGSLVGSTVGSAGVFVYKNGAIYTQGSAVPNNTNLGACSSATDLIYMNGSTDYIEMYIWQNSGGSLNTQADPRSQVFSACLVRAA